MLLAGAKEQRYLDQFWEAKKEQGIGAVHVRRVYPFSLWNWHYLCILNWTQLYAHPFSSEIIQELHKMLDFSVTQRIRLFKAKNMGIIWECKYSWNHSHVPWALVIWQVYGLFLQLEWPRFELPPTWGALTSSLIPHPLITDFTRLMSRLIYKTETLRFPATQCSLILLTCLHVSFLMSGFCQRTCRSPCCCPCCRDSHCSLLFF